MFIHGPHAPRSAPKQLYIFVLNADDSSVPLEVSVQLQETILICSFLRQASIDQTTDTVSYFKKLHGTLVCLVKCSDPIVADGLPGSL